MLEFKKLFNSMLTHFPKWMDIRKRANKSNGGQLIASIAEETELIQEAIYDYQKDFFIESYFGNEDKIFSIVYRIQVGDISPNTIKITSLDLIYTADIKTFYSETGYFYYENGYLFFRKEDIEKLNEETNEVFIENLQYSIKTKIYTALPKKYQVWNIFDEFAKFVGLERHEWETNLELETRILTAFKEKINGTEEGLKYALYTELMTLDPELTLDDITIEGATPDNVIKLSDDKVILDIMAAINKDCYQYKKWDLDPWYYDIQSIDYIPHQWDKSLDKIKDGIGKTNDLSIKMSTPTDTTEASILFYEENEETLETYIKSIKKPIDINLNLYRNNNEIKPIESTYTIIASKAIDITNDSIYLNSYSEKYENKRFSLDSVAIDTNNITIKDNREYLPNGAILDLKFIPIDTHYLSTIDCKLINAETGDIINLLTENDCFKFNEKEQLQSIYNVKAITSTYDLSDSNFIVNNELGLTLDSAETEGDLSFSFEAPARYLYLKHDCPLSSILDYNITANNFTKNNGVYNSIATSGDVSITSLLKANHIYFEITGKAYVTVMKNGVYLLNNQIIEDNSYMTSPTNIPNDYFIFITPVNNLEPIQVKNLAYSQYFIEATVNNNAVQFNENNLIVLDYVDKYDVKIRVKSQTNKTPYFGFYINKSNINVSRLEYNIPQVKIPDNGRYYLEVNTNNHRLDIYQGNTIYKNNYESSSIEYIANSGEGIIYLELPYFTEVYNIVCSSGKIESLSSGNNRFSITLDQGKSLSFVQAEGITYRNQQSLYLLDELGLDPSKGDKLYITNLLNGFICEQNGHQEVKLLKEVPSLAQTLNSSIVDVTSSNPNFKDIINIVYIRDFEGYNNKIITEGKYIGSIKDIILTPKEQEEYIAYGSQILFDSILENVEMNNNFYPIINNDLMCYLIQDRTKDVDVIFDNSDSYFSVGKSNLSFKLNTTLNDDTLYNNELTTITYETTLAKTIMLPEIFNYNGMNIELSKYIIEPPNHSYTIIYQSINDSMEFIQDKSKFYRLETISKNINGYNKLEYCNVDQIVQFGIGDPNDPNNFITIPETDYDLLKDKGIIVWKKEAKDKYLYNVIYVKYTIKIPVAISLANNLLYKLSGSQTLDGYKLVYQMMDIKIGKDNFLDLTDNPYFDNNHKIVVQCSNPNFNAFITNKGIEFNRINTDYALFTKTGYYYINGKEYYLFANEVNDSTEQTINVQYDNITKDGELLILNKSSKNYIANSLFNSNVRGEVYNKNFKQNPKVFGVSAFNSLTACSTFNFWTTIGMQLSFCEGLNPTAIRFTPILKNGYAFIPLKDCLFEKTKISCYCKEHLKLFIGENLVVDNMTLIDANCINIIDSFNMTTTEDNIYEIIFEPDLQKEYFLIVQGEGILDDIIIIDNKNFYSYIDYHTKNINSLGLNIPEQISDVYTARLPFYNTKGYKGDSAEIDKDNNIITSANINWGLTKIKQFNNYNDWLYCEQHKVKIENNILLTKDEAGYVITNPIDLGDLDLIKTLVFKINDIAFDSLTGFTTTILSSNTYDGIYGQKGLIKDNYYVLKDNITSLNRFIKLKIEIPPNKMINDLTFYIEYKTTDDKAPIGQISHTGTLISEIYDTQYEKNFTLSDVKINSISNINNVKLEIRAAKTNVTENIWTNWKTIILNKDLNITNYLNFDKYRYFQLKVTLLQQDAFINIDYIELTTKGD